MLLVESLLPLDSSSDRLRLTFLWLALIWIRAVGSASLCNKLPYYITLHYIYSTDRHVLAIMQAP
jgi:hypothetical protein